LNISLFNWSNKVKEGANTGAEMSEAEEGVAMAGAVICEKQYVLSLLRLSPPLLKAPRMQLNVFLRLLAPATRLYNHQWVIEHCIKEVL